jgi:hypothetical protein
MQNTHYSCHVLMRLEFSPRIFEKYSNNKFHENPSSDSRDGPCRRTDRQRVMTKKIVVFCNFAKAPKKVQVAYVILHENTLYITNRPFVQLRQCNRYSDYGTDNMPEKPLFRSW